ncbi:MAG: hypothetical protein KJ044_10700 [Planctomycetes bacterium]|nr:hypothetical protein [Planctomycetota bacterium]
MMPDGRATFTSDGFAAAPPYDLSTPGPDLHGTIFAFAANLWQVLLEEPAAMQAYFESDRVVLQWREMGHVGYSISCGYAQFSFQVHLRQDYAIEIHYGPEKLPSGYTESFLFTSGIVSPSGASTVNGLGNSSTPQSTRPANGDRVVFTPSGFTFQTGMELTHNALVGSMQKGKPGDTDVVIASFRLRCHITNTTFTGLTLSFSSFVTGTARLYRDIANAGALDPLFDTQLATAAAGSSITFSSFSESFLPGTEINYLVVVDITAVSNISEGFARVTSLTTGTTTWWGTYYGLPFSMREGPAGTAAFTFRNYGSFEHLALTDGSERPVAEFELRAEPGSNFTMTGVAVSLNAINGFNLAFVAEVRLHRMTATSSVMIGSMPPATNFTFAGLNEPATTAGQDYQVTILISNTYTGYGSIEVAVTQLLTSPSVVRLSGFNPNPRKFDVVGSGIAQVYANNNRDGYLDVLPVQPGATNVPALSFYMKSSVAPPFTITNLIFGTTTTVAIAAARLYIDSGLQPGLVDAGDTGLSYTTTINATDITFSLIGGLTATFSGTNVLMVVDIAPGAAPTTNLAFWLDQSDNAAANSFLRCGYSEVAPTVPRIYGPALDIRNGVAQAGIDITVERVTDNVTARPGQPVALFRITCAARGAGGLLPDLTFDVNFGFGGVGNSSGLRPILYLEGGGPLGVIDISDTANAYNSLIGPLNSNSLFSLAGGQMFCTTGQTRRFLFAVIQDETALGYCQIRLSGIHDGTNVQVVPGSVHMTGGVLVELVPTPPPLPPPPPRDDEGVGSCRLRLAADGVPFAPAVFLAAIASVALLRRRRAVKSQ